MKNDKQQPVYWKLVILTIGTVYPLIMGCDYILALLFPIHELPPYLSIFITVIPVAALMTYPVMPISMRILDGWLYKKK